MLKIPSFTDEVKRDHVAKLIKHLDMAKQTREYSAKSTQQPKAINWNCLIVNHSMGRQKPIIVSTSLRSTDTLSRFENYQNQSYKQFSTTIKNRRLLLWNRCLWRWHAALTFWQGKNADIQDYGACANYLPLDPSLHYTLFVFTWHLRIIQAITFIC